MASDIDVAEKWRRRAELAFESAHKHPLLNGMILYGPPEQVPRHLQRFRPMNREELITYKKKCSESNGYDVSGCTGLLSGGIVEVKKSDYSTFKVLRKSAEFAVERHNEEVKKDLIYVDLVKANIQTVAGNMLYLTLKAFDEQDGQEKLYRAKVYRCRGVNKELVEFKEAPISPSTEIGAAAPSGIKKKIKRPRGRPPSRSRIIRPFMRFVETLRNKPENADKKYSEVLSIASAQWKSMKDRAKAVYK